METFDFDESISITILDANPPGTVIVSPGNLVVTSGTNANLANDGFSIQLSGAFTSIQFLTNVNLVPQSNSVGFSVATAATAAVPEPSTIVLLTLGLIATGLARRAATVGRDGTCTTR